MSKLKCAYKDEVFIKHQKVLDFFIYIIPQSHKKIGEKWTIRLIAI